ncbi:MAG: argininosuccinate synthase [Flavobacteriaceae bacterium]|nr:argininosuccinate synthase [Flavobacteriaceae bacterium]
MKKLVLAYSGGLDTSYCIKFLSQNGYQVHAVSVNTGGFDKIETEQLAKKAEALGAASYTPIDAVSRFYQKIVKYLVFGNVLKNNTYPLSVSAERVIQAVAIAEHAQKINAQCIAHGSTGAGNDQVRFDMIFQIICPDIEIVTPIRDQQLSRESEIEYLKSHGVDWPWEKAQYSINKGLWGTSVGGSETLKSRDPLPETAYPSQLTSTASKTISLQFEKGELVGIDKTKYDPVEAIQKLQELASSYAIGRDIHVGDTIIGIKGRVGFEAAAPMVIIKAHHLLEKHTLSKWQQFQKDQMANFYGMQLHEGQYLDPVMRDIEVFLENTQKTVSGSVYVTLHPHRFTLDGIESPFDLMDSSFGSYGEMNLGWTAEEAKGFIKISANANKIHQHVNNK